MKDKKNIYNEKYGLLSSILIALGPILWLFINIYNKNYKYMLLNIVIVIFVATLVFYNLKNYLKIYNKKGSAKLDILRRIVSFIFYILLAAVMLIAFLVFYAVIAFIQQELFVKGEYITYLIKSPYSYLLFLVLVIVTNKIIMMISKGEKIFLNKKYLDLWRKIDKALMISIIPLLYIVLTSVVVITEDGIYDYSFYNLKGNKYSFNEVEEVDTGFVTRGRGKGEFFYNIKLENGKKLKLAYQSSPQPSDKYDYNTWQEYVDLDQYIMRSGAEKDSSEKGSNYVMMDQKYIDKLLKVIRNK